MDHSRNAQIYYGNDDDIEDDAQSNLMPYYDDEEDEIPIEVNDDSYWDVYYDPTGPDNLHTSFSD
jgi:hypothetical protein